MSHYILETMFGFTHSKQNVWKLPHNFKLSFSPAIFVILWHLTEINVIYKWLTFHKKMCCDIRRLTLIFSLSICTFSYDNLYNYRSICSYMEFYKTNKNVHKNKIIELLSKFKFVYMVKELHIYRPMTKTFNGSLLFNFVNVNLSKFVGFWLFFFC